MRSLPFSLAALGLLSAAGPPPAQAPPPRSPAAPARTLRVAAVQMRSRPDLDANVRHTVAWLRRCAAERAQVAVFPECSVSGYFADYVPKLSAQKLRAA